MRRAGGFTQGADRPASWSCARTAAVRRYPARAVLRPGDEIMVLPKVETKNIEVARGITQIIYQIAVAAKVVFGL